MRRFLLRILSSLRAGRADAELTREIDAHLQLLEDRFLAGGLTPDEARWAARRAFGGQVEQVKERQRDARSVRWMDESWLDLKLGVRMLVKFPGLTLIAVIALSVAIGVGAYLEFVNEAIRPSLPVPDGDRIVGVQQWNVVTGSPEHRSLRDFVAWREQVTSIELLGAYRPLERQPDQRRRARRIGARRRARTPVVRSRVGSVRRSDLTSSRSGRRSPTDSCRCASSMP